MCTWLHVYVATCINVYKGTGIWREFLHASPNNPKCQGKRQDLRSHLFKSEGADVEIGVIVLILIFIDEVHHLLIGSLSLLNAGLGSPFPDGFSDSAVNIIATILKWFAGCADAAFFWKIIAFIVGVIDLTSTLAASVGNAQFIIQESVYLKEEVIASIPGCFGLERKKTGVFILLILCPVDVTTHADVLLLIVDSIVLGEVIQPDVPAVHLHALKGVPKVAYCLFGSCDLIGRCCLICYYFVYLFDYHSV